MTIQHTNGQQIDVSLRDSDTDICGSDLIVERAWLPMLIWEGVQVVIRSNRGLTLMERFAIQCLITLEKCRAEELLEIASIPPELADWLLGSLIQMNLAYRSGNGFSPNTDACARALNEKCVPIEKKSQRSFLWFPESHELAVIPDAGFLIQQLRHVQPHGIFPLPAEWADSTRGQVIRDAIKRGRLYGEKAREIGDANDNSPLKGIDCSAYYCHALVPQNGTDQWKIAVMGSRKRKALSHVGKENTNACADEMVEQALPIPLLPELAHTWRERLGRAHDAIKHFLEQKLGLAYANIEGSHMAAEVTGDAASGIRRDRLLANGVGVTVRIDGEIVYALALQLQPSPTDPAAQKLFSLDDTVREILAAPNTPESTQMICTKRGFQLSEIIERLWEVKLFRKVYELREREDFSG